MKNVGASIQARLKTMSKTSDMDMPGLLRRYVQERLLYRLSISPEGSKFALKGGLLLAAYNDGEMLRSSDDVDFNGFDENGDIEMLKETLLSVLRIETIDDGVTFDIDSMNITKDRTGKVPGGKIVMSAFVGTARVSLKVDVGFGNPVTPETRLIEFPTMFEDISPRPIMNSYPLETVIAEKLHAMAQFGLSSTRIKDHYDIYRISLLHSFDGDLLANAIKTTFVHQDRVIPESISCLSNQYVRESTTAWKKFVAKIPGFKDTDFSAVVYHLNEFITPSLEDARLGHRSGLLWDPERGWNDNSPSPSM